MKLPLQRVRAADAFVSINIELPAGYHLNPSAPQRYQVTVNQPGEAKPVTIDNRSNHPLALPLHLPVNLHAASAEIVGSFTFVYCREDNTGVCRIKTIKWRAPVEVVNDNAAPNQISFSATVTSN